MKHFSFGLPIFVSFLVWIGIALAAPMLAGSEWGISSNPKQFIQFQSNGRVAGHGGCNRFFGSYKQSEDSLQFGPLGATKMMCPAEIMQQEDALFAILSKVDRFERKRHLLKLFDSFGQDIVTLRQRDWD